jgi:hypothetical protein
MKDKECTNGGRKMYVHEKEDERKEINRERK